MLRARGFARVRGHLTDDVALGRLLARDGWKVAFRDAGALLRVDMHDSAAGVWREWGRSIALRDVTAPGALAADLAALVGLTLALPVLRLGAGHPRSPGPRRPAQPAPPGEALRGSYARPGAGLALSPLLDPLTAVRLTWSALRPARTWRGRVDPPPGRLAPPRRTRPRRTRSCRMPPRRARRRGTRRCGTRRRGTRRCRPRRHRRPAVPRGSRSAPPPGSAGRHARDVTHGAGTRGVPPRPA